jgi:aminoglycoside phosphotransferase (APT) family kinase protein
VAPPEPDGTDGDLAARIGAYARTRLPDARDVTVSGVERIHGGASRETFRFVLEYSRGGERVSRRLILRRDPTASLIETDRAVEFGAYAAFHGTAVPVPEPLWLEQDPHHLDHPFFVMAELVGYEASPLRLLEFPYAAHGERIGTRAWTLLGEIARRDPAELGLVGVMEPVAADAAWIRELAFWERVLDEDEIDPQPIVRAAIRWLRGHPPPAAQKLAVVHGDYRTGNFLYGPDGEIGGILDWEMAHLGDPLEDLAWSINRVWCWARDDRVGGLIPRAHAVRLWEAASGLRADPAALHWWELFSCVKGQGIWVSAARAYHDGTNRDPMMAIPCWMQGNSQDRATLELMGHLA